MLFMLLVVGAVLLVAAVFLSWMRTAKRPSVWERGGAVPLLGHLQQFASRSDGDVGKMVQEWWAEAIAQGHVTHELGMFAFFLGRRRCIAVCTADRLKRLFSSSNTKVINDRFVTRILKESTLGSKDFVTAPYGRYWRTVRKAVHQSLSSTPLNEMESCMLELIDDLVEECRRSSQLDAARSFRSLTMSLMLRLLLGRVPPVSEEERRRAIEAVDSIFLNTSKMDLRDWIGWPLEGVFPEPAHFKENREDVRVLTSFLRKCIEGLPESGTILASMLKALPDLSNEEYVANAMALIFGGTESSASTLTWCALMLANYPAEQEVIAEECSRVVREGTSSFISWADRERIPRTRAFLAEVMRYRPIAAWTFPHLTLSEISLEDGCTIPEGTVILPMALCFAADETVFAEADQFKPNRFLRTADDGNVSYIDDLSSFLPFGTGVRECVGRALAERELLLSLANMVAHIQLRSRSVEKLDEGPVFGFTYTAKPFVLDVEDRSR